MGSAPEAPAGESPVAAPKPASRKSGVVNPYVWGTGRRKAAVARVRVRPGNGKYLINDREVDTYFCLSKDRATVREPLRVTESEKAFDVFVNVVGGGITGQAGAVLLGLARALANSNPDYSIKLRERQMLSRDARRVERKKYGLSGARKSYQFSKR